MSVIKAYKTGNELLEENKEYLDLNPYVSIFFYLDAPYLKVTNKTNYAIRIENNNKKLLAIKVEPYSLILYGDNRLSIDLVRFLYENGYVFSNILGPEELVDEVTKVIKDNYNIEYYEALAMDFMEVKAISEPSCKEVEIPTIEDLNTIISYKENFFKDCGLLDKVSIEKVKETLSNYRILKVDGIIVAMAYFAKATDNSYKISDVYTYPTYRGKGYAKKIVATIKNEIISNGYIATLNVDKKNPISNKIYYDLGFRKVFSQGEYRRK